MSTWTKVRSLLEDRYIEIAQEEVASNPKETAGRLTDFLHIPEHRDAIADLFRSQRPDTAFPEKPPGDYSYEISWSKEQKRYFIQACREEMKAWRYSFDCIEPIDMLTRAMIETSFGSTWSDRCRKAWTMLRSDGLLALLDWTRRSLYWRYIRPGISALRDRSS
jgi:hypothetical protein